jgi:ethanolamine utilization microcompartment shell protein EutL
VVGVPRTSLLVRQIHGGGGGGRSEAAAAVIVVVRGHHVADFGLASAIHYVGERASTYFP